MVLEAVNVVLLDWTALYYTVCKKMYTILYNFGLVDQ